jgi:hypothetical protein
MFKSHACHKIDKYLDENYAIQLSWYQREELVFSLLGELQYYSTNKIEVTRDKFECKFFYLIKSQADFTDWELKDSKKFRLDYRFDASPLLRFAIRKFYNQSRKIQKRSFKKCINFLDVDLNTKNLKVVYPKDDMFFFYIGRLLLVIIAIPTIGCSFLMVFVHEIFALLLFLCLFYLYLLMPMVLPYWKARRIDRELKELYREK